MEGSDNPLLFILKQGSRYRDRLFIIKLNLKKMPQEMKKWKDYEKFVVTLSCVEHILNPELAEQSWDNPYDKEDAIRILKKLYSLEYNEDYINKLFKS